MQCWRCGAQAEVIEVWSLSEAEPRLIPGPWDSPAEGHQHAVRPPSPAQLLDAGHRTLMRICAEANDVTREGR